MAQHVIFIFFFFALGACIGSFLNVVVWRLPRGESLVTPPSRCPKCEARLAWFDNIPIFGWLALRGKCRYCKATISPRYPIIEAVTALLFVLIYVVFFVEQEGLCRVRLMTIADDWPMYLLYVALIAGLLASSLIDAELFQIPIGIPWTIAIMALGTHALTDTPATPGALLTAPPLGAMAAGATLGLFISLLLLKTKILPRSFAEGSPLLDWEKQQRDQAEAAARAQGRELTEPPVVEFTPAQIRTEISKEMLFLMPPLLLGGAWVLLTWKVPAVARFWESFMTRWWLSALLGSLWGGYVGAMLIWGMRIFGSIVFGREAMGLGDVDLMFAIGAVVGGAGATFVFFVAPFIGIVYGLWKLITHRGREVPYGPFLSAATLIVVLCYCRMIDYFGPPLNQLVMVVSQKFSNP